ncbi:MAG: TIGR03752 family integrating conjugative element protein [Geminicoccales bacterium]
MARLTSNKLLPILGGVVLVTTGAVAAGSLFTKGDPTPVPRAAPPDALEMPDGDTAVDTIRTLRAELMAANEKFENVVEQNERLLDDNQDLRQEQTSLRQDITSDLEEKLATASSDQSSQIDKTVSEFSEQLASLQQSLTVNKPAAPAVTDQAGSSSVLPSAHSYPIVGAPNATNYVWIEPLDGASGTAPLPDGLTPTTTGTADLLPSGFAPSGSPLALNTGDAAGGVEALRDGTAAAGAEPLAPTPYFTINNLATLAGSTAFTALIGRVPINGQIADPVPFRVLVGRENLAASGLRVPDEIASMVFEGVAIGDWTLGCVEGSLRTATFIFEDGTIRTVSGGSGQDGRLGYIADEFGTPCVAGEKISNAAGYLTAQIALAAGGGAADAFAAAQTAQVVDGGAVVSAVVGDAAQFALGRAASNATQEVQRYLADRLSNTFDAVYVPPGQKVGLLIQQEIAIDYDPNGRKLDHAQGGVGRVRNLD